MYLLRGGWDITPHFHGHLQIDQYRCRETGMLFWRPEDLAGCESFYRQLSADEKHYYQPVRWEYELLDRYLSPEARILEVGCGRGYFLKRAEGRVKDASGIEFNTQAIADKVTMWPIRAERIEDSASGALDLVCSFHVLEHVTDPAGFVEQSLARLRPGGRLVLSVPNHENAVLAASQDAFDLPPHHINHFTPNVFRRIGERYGLALEQLVVERRAYEPPTVTPATSSRLTFKAARFIARQMFGWVYRSEPGHSMLAVFRKLG